MWLTNEVGGKSGVIEENHWPKPTEKTDGKNLWAVRLILDLSCLWQTSSWHSRHANFSSHITKRTIGQHLPQCPYFTQVDKMGVTIQGSSEPNCHLHQYRWSITTAVLGCWLLIVGCLTSQQHASVSQGQIWSDNCMCCHTEIEAADQTFYFTQSQYTDIWPTSPSADPTMPGTWQGSHWSANFKVTGMTRPGKILSQAGFEPRIFRSQGGCPNH